MECQIQLRDWYECLCGFCLSVCFIDSSFKPKSYKDFKQQTVLALEIQPKSIINFYLKGNYVAKNEQKCSW